MQEQSRFVVGIDVGTTTVRCVVGSVDPTTGVPAIVGVGQAPNNGMRKGTVVNLNGPARAIDAALGEAERMSGHEVNEATLSINGSHVMSTKSDGMIAVGIANHEIDNEDVHRIEEVATTGKVPANRQVLEVVPLTYVLDGQTGIKDPTGMTGTRLEVKANVVSAMVPHVINLQKSAEMATVASNALIPSVMAGAKATLRERQIENGVAVIDIGGATTGVAVYEEGDLQYVGVVPMGSVNITNDLAIGLKTDPEIAEEVKLKHAHATPRSDNEGVSVKHDGKVYSFETNEIDEIVEARLEELFTAVNHELKRAGRAGQLPNGVVLTGGGANLKGIAEYAKSQLNLAVQVGKPTGFQGMADGADKPEFAAAIGLMIADAEGGGQPAHNGPAHDGAPFMKQAGGFFKGIGKRFKI